MNQDPETRTTQDAEERPDAVAPEFRNHGRFDGAWFFAALRGVDDAVVAVDVHGRIIFLNPAAENLTRWSEAEALGRAASDVYRIIDERTREPVGDAVSRSLVGDGGSIEWRRILLVARDGTESPISARTTAVRGADGELSGALATFRDVGELRRATEIRERLAAIVESSDDVIVSKSLDGVITSWNKAAQRILGYAPEEVVGRNVSSLMPPESIEDFPMILGRIARGERVDHYETKRIAKDGRIVDLSLTVSPIRDSEGVIVGASKIGRDITRHKQIEADRIEADRLKDEFLAMLAHELRNPLSSINNAVQLIDVVRDPNEFEWAKRVVRTHVRALVRILDDLLDMSRITTGKIRLKVKRTDIAAAAKAAVESVRTLIEERGHSLTISRVGGGEGPIVEGDPLRLEQIFANLLSNAAKYTPPGGKIGLSIRIEDESAVVRVKDNGLGIDAALLPRVFDMFRQAERSPARTEGGLGIGLTLVKRLTEMHGGVVTASSGGAGKGSEFVVRLPLAKSEPVPEPVPEPSAHPIPRPGSRVLVVDDNPDTATGLAKLFQLLGHAVETAFDGESALALARSHRPQIVLLDIGLPGIDGYEVARRIRGEDFGGDAFVVAVTGYGQEEDRRRSREAGFDHHMVKPVDYQALLNLVEERVSA